MPEPVSAEKNDSVEAAGARPDLPVDQLLPPEPGTVDEWWLSDYGDDELVSAIGLGVAHHHATNHPGGGGGDDEYECFECPFAVEAGRVVNGGWVRFKADNG